jgi:hypothetical protein
MKPAQMKAAAKTSVVANTFRRKRRAHEGQKRRLVHKRQRARVTRSPHSEQKFGRYMLASPSR